MHVGYANGIKLRWILQGKVQFAWTSEHIFAKLISFISLKLKYFAYMISNRHCLCTRRSPLIRCAKVVIKNDFFAW